MTPPAARRPPTRGSVRIIGGRWKRTPLAVGDAPGLRPTPDRVRETLFNWLAHALGDLQDRAFLDLYAGSGALGFEAASRGAHRVVLVEQQPRIAALLHATRAKLAADAVDILQGDALTVARRLRDDGSRFDVVFLDPPFGQNILATALPVAVALCAPAGLVYVESDSPLTETTAAALGLASYRADRAGEVFYHLLQCKRTN